MFVKLQAIKIYKKMC